MDLTDQSLGDGLVLKGEKRVRAKEKVLTPYGLPCVRELLRFLVSLVSTEER